jgi:predicted Zn-dependent protease
VLHYNYARALVGAGRLEEAERQLRRAIEVEPCYAMPYYLLGRLYDRAQMNDEAAQQYASFVAHAPRAIDEYAWTSGRLAELRAAAPSAAPASGSGG